MNKIRAQSRIIDVVHTENQRIQQNQNNQNQDINEIEYQQNAQQQKKKTTQNTSMMKKFWEWKTGNADVATRK